MFRFLVFLLVVLGLGLLFAWVADNPGTIFLQWEWLSSNLGRPGEEVQRAPYGPSPRGAAAAGRSHGPRASGRGRA